MNPHLNKKLLNYSSMCAGTLLAPLTVSSQIIYQDISPDKIVTGSGISDSLDLDFNGDYDVNFICLENSGSGTFLSGYYAGYLYNSYGNAAFVKGSSSAEFLIDNFYEIKALNVNNPINSNQLFYNFSPSYRQLGVKIDLVAQSISYTGVTSWGNWPGMYDKYLGVKFVNGSGLHYGWIRMDVTVDCDSIIIKDYAYNSTPNTGLLAGQTSISVEEEQEAGISIRSYQNSLFIRRKENSQEDLAVYALDGKLIFEKRLISDYEIISLGEIPKGIYIVKCGNVSKKIII